MWVTEDAQELNPKEGKGGKETVQSRNTVDKRHSL